MLRSFLKRKKDKESSESVIQHGATVNSIKETTSEKTSDGFVPTVTEYATKDGLNMKCVSLASHEMAPSKFKKLHFLKNIKQAKQSFKQHKKAEIRELIVKGRENQNRGIPADLIAALGSDEEIYSVGADCGMFAAVFTAYSYHYKLRTSPDDWWFCVIKQVARAIDESAQEESVRKVFVDHEGKNVIEIPVEDPTIYTVDYNWFFDQITKAIKENVKVPEFVDGMTADFGTTTPVQKIVSQITLMYSMKHYFDFDIIMGCGIPAVEMLGTEEDWQKLTTKLKVLRTLLEPMENDLCFRPGWWDVIQNIFCKLLETYQGKPDEKWWSHIMDYEEEYASGMVCFQIDFYVTVCCRRTRAEAQLSSYLVEENKRT